MNWNLNRQDSVAAVDANYLLITFSGTAGTAPVVQSIRDVLAASPNASDTVRGWMSSADKDKLDDIDIRSVSGMDFASDTLTLRYVDGAGTAQQAQVTVPLSTSGDGVVNSASYGAQNRQLTLGRTVGGDVSVILPVASSTADGLMDNADKAKLDALNIRTISSFSHAAGTLQLRFLNGAGGTETRSIPLVTTAASGIMSSSDKSKLDDLDVDSITGITVSGQTLTLTWVDSAGVTQTSAATLPSGGGQGSNDGVVDAVSYAAQNRTLTLGRTVGADLSVQLPLVDGTNAGLMSNTDKSKLDNLNVRGGFRYTNNGATRQFSFSDASGVERNVAVPNASRTVSGMMSSSDKARLDSINFRGGIQYNNSGAVLRFSYLDGNGARQNVSVPVATTARNGLLSSTDKSRLDGLSDMAIRDLIGAMVSGNTETGISVTYDSATGKLNFVVSGGGGTVTPPPARTHQRYYAFGADSTFTASDMTSGTGFMTDSIAVTGFTVNNFVAFWSAESLTNISNPVLGIPLGSNQITIFFNRSRLQIGATNGYLYVTKTIVIAAAAVNQTWTVR